MGPSSAESFSEQATALLESRCACRHAHPFSCSILFQLC